MKLKEIERFFCNMFQNSDDHFSSAALKTKKVKLSAVGFFWQKFGFFYCVLTFNSSWYKGCSCYSTSISPIFLCGMSKLYLLVEKWCFKRQFQRLFPNSKGCNIDGLDTKAWPLRTHIEEAYFLVLKKPWKCAHHPQLLRLFAKSACLD